MLCSIIIALLVLLIGMFYIYQGFFSALLMLIASIIACVVAVNYYEGLHEMWKDSIGPGIGYPLAFMAIFIPLLAVMRIGADQLIRGNVSLPKAIDRAGGAVCGLFSGLVLIGSVLFAVQMLPIGSDVFGFERFQPNEDGVNVRKNFYLKPDNFAVGMVEMLSSGAFAGENSFARAKPDVLADLYAARAVTQTGDRQVVPDNALVVRSIRETNRIDQVTHAASGHNLKRDFTPTTAAEGMKFLVCTVQLSNSAAREKSSDIRFRLPAFRIFGPPPHASKEPPRAYIATGMSDLYINNKHSLVRIDAAQAARLVRFSSDTKFILNPEIAGAIGVTSQDLAGQDVVGAYQFEVAFEVPEDFKPWYMEFKRGARFDFARLQQPAGGRKTSPPDSGSSAGRTPVDDAATASSGETPPNPEEPAVGEAPKGRTHVASAVKRGTGVRDELPIALDRRNSSITSQIQLRGDRFMEGHLVTDSPSEPAGEGDQIARFYVPDEKRLVQIGWEPSFPQSMFGRALHFAGNVAPKIRVVDETGTEYFAIGLYAEAAVGGKRVLEIQYWPEAEMPERALRKPRQLTDSVVGADLENNPLGYLFLVPPGVNLVEFRANNAHQRISIVVP